MSEARESPEIDKLIEEFEFAVLGRAFYASSPRSCERVQTAKNALREVLADGVMGTPAPLCGEPEEDYLERTAKPLRSAAVHFDHCYQGEYAHSCKYGDADCPAAHGVIASDDAQDARRYRQLRKGLPLTVIVPTPTDDKPNKKVTISYGPNPEEAWSESLDRAVDAAIGVTVPDGQVKRGGTDDQP